ncbi:hypothetical protein L198_01286 [Cryptococcus wingfieldii CBS 7118]|uniref:Uncharacterized protein n=1 Tax=Cryptococcus wingfieldii CBS 7118 TaxID=1295528 RepID=A0A1E3K0N8_9TREE|nr:hypothetical protein L198_01286 [Cryptococcus wingfieldii CBS 7118]ODO06057.1 hypothetical protein L198_01286 [Cryptococcus wingfieldii CBS 7118]
MPSQPDAIYDVSDRFEEDFESIAISRRAASGSAIGEMGQHGCLDPAHQPFGQQLVSPSRFSYEQPPYPSASPAFRAPPYPHLPPDPAPNTYLDNSLRTSGSSSSIGFKALNQPSRHYNSSMDHPIVNAGIPGANHLPGREAAGVGSSFLVKRGRESETMTAYNSKKKSATFDQCRGEWGGGQTGATMGSAAGSTVAHQYQSNPPSTSTPFSSSIDSSAVPHPIETSDAFPFGPLQSGSGINTTPSELPSFGSSASFDTFTSAGIDLMYNNQQQWASPPGFLQPQQTSGLDMMGMGGDFDVAGRDMGTQRQQGSGHGREMWMGGVGRPEGGAYEQVQHQERPASVSAPMAPNQNQQSDSGISPSYVPPSYVFGLPDPGQPLAPPAHNSNAITAPHFDQTFLEDTASSQAASHASALPVTLPPNSSQYAYGMNVPPAGSAPDAASRSADAQFMQPPPPVTQGSSQEQAVAPLQPRNAPHPAPTHFSPSKSKAASDKEELGYEIIGIGKTFPPKFVHTPALVEAFNTVFSTVYSDIYAQKERQTPRPGGVTVMESQALANARSRQDIMKKAAEMHYTKTAKHLRMEGKNQEWSIHEAMRQTEIKAQDEAREIQESVLAQQQMRENAQHAGQVNPPAPPAPFASSSQSSVGITQGTLSGDHGSAEQYQPQRHEGE